MHQASYVGKAGITLGSSSLYHKHSADQTTVLSLVWNPRGGLGTTLSREVHTQDSTGLMISAVSRISVTQAGRRPWAVYCAQAWCVPGKLY